MAQNSTNHSPFQLFMRPMYIKGILDVITKYRWTHLLYVYDTDEGKFPALSCRFKTNGYISKREHSKLKVNNVKDVVALIKERLLKQIRTCIDTLVYESVPKASYSWRKKSFIQWQLMCKRETKTFRSEWFPPLEAYPFTLPFTIRYHISANVDN